MADIKKLAELVSSEDYLTSFYECFYEGDMEDRNTIIDLCEFLLQKEKYKLLYAIAKTILTKNLNSWFTTKFLRFISVSAFYVNEMQEGYDAAEYIIQNNPDDHLAQINQGFYTKPIDFDKTIELKIDTPEGYFMSSPCIYRNPKTDGYYGNIRVVNYKINEKGGYIYPGYVHTRNYKVNYDSKFNLLDSSEFECPTPPVHENVQVKGIEDLRLLSKTQFLATSFEYHEKPVPQMVLGSNEKIIPLKGLNQCEKNWVTILDEFNDSVDTAKIIYSLQPLVIYELNTKTGDLKVIKAHDKFECCRTARGSSNFIPYIDETGEGYLGLIHRVGHAQPRQYYHQFIFLTKDFETIKTSKVFYFEKRQIEFCLAMDYTHDLQNLMINYSINDGCSKLGFLSLEKLKILFD